MSYKNFMKKIRYWDNQTSKWMLKHFYFLFFQIVLVTIFVTWFINTINSIEINAPTTEASTIERILVNQSVSISIITILAILNSFWMLYMFNGIQRIMNVLKDINYGITKLRYKK